MNGYIALHKKILDWGWYTDINTCRLFIHILLRANWEDKMWKGMLIKRGQWATSLQTICNETALTPREVRTAIDHLKSTGEIDKVTTSRNTVITVLNYDSYQVSDKPSDITTTNQRQQLNKEINKDINKCPTEPDESAREREEKILHNFEIIYKAYPRHEGRQKGYKYYRAFISKGKEINGKRYKLTNEQIYKAIKKYAEKKDGCDKQYILLFSTFMNETIIDYLEGA